MARFSGGTSFMSNGYVIWRNGLAGQEPNWFGVKQGSTYVDKMFYIRSMDQRSSYYHFLSYLETIQKKEADKERAYLDLKLQKMRQNPLQKNRVEAIQRAVDDNNFGAAYTLMLNLDQDLKDLKRELTESKHFNNISHMNRFWKTQFSDFLRRAIIEKTEIQGHKLVQKLGTSSMTIGDLVDDWMMEMLQGSTGAVKESLEPIRAQMKSELLHYIQKAGITGVNSYTDDILGTSNNFTSLSGYKTTYSTKKKGDKELTSMAKLIADAIGNAVGKGMSQEVTVTSEQGRDAVSFNTGTFQKDITTGLRNDGFAKVYQRADVTSFEMFEGEYDIEKLASSVFDKYGYSQDSYNKFVELLEEAAKQNAGQFFQVSTNVKGYRSKRDLSIEGAGSFNQRTKILMKMAQEAEGIPAFSMEKLIFMLNNTVEGCIADGETENLVNYFAAVCTAWMWDDYTDLFSVSEDSSSIQKIRMFNSGGMYYSASQIIGKTLEELQMQYSSGSSFVKVDINPPSFDADSMYESLMVLHPAPSDNDPAAWQAALAPRWDSMRDYVSTHGTIGIKFIQEGLEKLMVNLSAYL